MIVQWPLWPIWCVTTLVTAAPLAAFLPPRNDVRLVQRDPLIWFALWVALYKCPITLQLHPLAVDLPPVYGISWIFPWHLWTTSLIWRNARNRPLLCLQLLSGVLKMSRLHVRMAVILRSLSSRAFFLPGYLLVTAVTWVGSASKSFRVWLQLQVGLALEFHSRILEFTIKILTFPVWCCF